MPKYLVYDTMYADVMFEAPSLEHALDWRKIWWEVCAEDGNDSKRDLVIYSLVVEDK